MARKVFEFESRQSIVQPEFEIGGEVIQCVDDAQLSTLDVLELIAGLTGGSGLTRLQTMVRLFDVMIRKDDAITKDGSDGPTTVVVGSSADRFRNVIRGKRVPLDVLNDIASWVLDEYLRFPTQADPQPSAPSSNGSTPGSSSNEAGSSAQLAVTSAT